MALLGFLSFRIFTSALEFTHDLSSLLTLKINPPLNFCPLKVCAIKGFFFFSLFASLHSFKITVLPTSGICTEIKWFGINAPLGLPLVSQKGCRPLQPRYPPARPVCLDPVVKRVTFLSKIIPSKRPGRNPPEGETNRETASMRTDESSGFPAPRRPPCTPGVVSGLCGPFPKLLMCSTCFECCRVVFFTELEPDLEIAAKI